MKSEKYSAQYSRAQDEMSWFVRPKFQNSKDIQFIKMQY